MRILRLSLLSCFTLLFFSCAKVFYSADAVELAKKHQTIAIAPPTVAIAAGRRIESEAIKEQQRTSSLNFQKEIHAWMLKRKGQGRITPEIQDIETTNARLKQAGYPDKPIAPSEMAELLGVDGVISSNFSLSKPMSEGAAIATGILLKNAYFGPTNEVVVSVSIHDKLAKKLIWNYDHKYSGSLGSTPERLVDRLMKKLSKKMPYSK